MDWWTAGYFSDDLLVSRELNGVPYGFATLSSFFASYYSGPRGYSEQYSETRSTSESRRTRSESGGTSMKVQVSSVMSEVDSTTVAITQQQQQQ
jgi:hypothetical protein